MGSIVESRSGAKFHSIYLYQEELDEIALFSYAQHHPGLTTATKLANGDFEITVAPRGKWGEEKFIVSPHVMQKGYDAILFRITLEECLRDPEWFEDAIRMSLKGECSYVGFVDNTTTRRQSNYIKSLFTGGIPKYLEDHSESAVSSTSATDAVTAQWRQLDTESRGSISSGTMGDNTCYSYTRSTFVEVLTEAFKQISVKDKLESAVDTLKDAMPKKPSFFRFSERKAWNEEASRREQASNQILAYCTMFNTIEAQLGKYEKESDEAQLERSQTVSGFADALDDVSTQISASMMEIRAQYMDDVKNHRISMTNIVPHIYLPRDVFAAVLKSVGLWSSQINRVIGTISSAAVLDPESLKKEIREGFFRSSTANKVIAVLEKFHLLDEYPVEHGRDDASSLEQKETPYVLPDTSRAAVGKIPTGRDAVGSSLGAGVSEVVAEGQEESPVIVGQTHEFDDDSPLERTGEIL
jgi:hypothetical protein